MPDTAVAALAAAGVLLVAAGLLWRWRARRRATTVLTRALRDPDPAIRRAAIEAAGAQGLAPFVDALTERTKKEASPAVRRVLADVIARSQWEPAGNERIVALRIWAHVELDTGTAARGSEVSTPAAVPPAADPKALEARVAEVLGERVLEARLELVGPARSSSRPGW
jgi:hypothetical protein